MCGTVEQVRDVLELPVELRDQRVIDAEEHGLGLQQIWHQAHGQGNGRVHETRIVHLCIGAVIVERIERLLRYLRQEVPVEEADGAGRFQRQHGKHKQEQRFGCRGGKGPKICRKIIIKVYRLCFFAI